MPLLKYYNTGVMVINTPQKEHAEKKDYMNMMLCITHISPLRSSLILLLDLHTAYICHLTVYNARQTMCQTAIIIIYGPTSCYGPGEAPVTPLMTHSYNVSIHQLVW